MRKVQVHSRKSAAKIRGVSVRTIDRMVAAGLLRKVQLSPGRIGIVDARKLPNENLMLAE